MATARLQTVAVFTGDLVGSRNLTKAQIDAAFSALETCAKKAEDWTGTSLKFSRHRGDGWQVILTQPKYVLRLAIIFRAAIKALGPEFDTYIGIARGNADVSDQTDLNSRNDEVFINSGRVLEAIKSISKSDIKMGYDGKAKEPVAIVLADKIVSDWTPIQSETIAEMLHSMDKITYTELAEKLNKSRQTITKTLVAAGYPTIEFALTFWENSND